MISCGTWMCTLLIIYLTSFNLFSIPLLRDLSNNLSFQSQIVHQKRFAHSIKLCLFISRGPLWCMKILVEEFCATDASSTRCAVHNSRMNFEHMQSAALKIDVLKWKLLCMFVALLSCGATDSLSFAENLVREPDNQYNDKSCVPFGAVVCVCEPRCVSCGQELSRLVEFQLSTSRGPVHDITHWSTKLVMSWEAVGDV